jgi:hypothetical protein
VPLGCNSGSTFGAILPTRAAKMPTRTIIVDCDPKVSDRFGRVELGRLERLLQAVERHSDRNGKLLGARRRQHAFGGADEQAVLEHVAQPGQSVTHSGLAQAQALAGARHISLLHHRVEYDEQVEVDRTEFHGRRSRGHCLRCTVDMYG